LVGSKKEKAHTSKEPKSFCEKAVFNGGLNVKRKRSPSGNRPPLRKETCKKKAKTERISIWAGGRTAAHGGRGLSFLKAFPEKPSGQGEA